MTPSGASETRFMHMETPQTPMHVGSLCLFELPPGRAGSFAADIEAHLARRLHLAPFLASRLSPAPSEADPPVWVEADGFSIDLHVHRHVLPEPGTPQQLDELVGRLHSGLLDRNHPLWECHVVDGLQGGRAAVYFKMHRLALAGDAGRQLTEALFDTTATPREVAPPPAKDPAAGTAGAVLGSPELFGLLGAAQTRLLRQQVRTLQMIPEAWQALARAMLPDRASMRDDPPDDDDAARPAAPRTPLGGRVSSRRAFAARSASVDGARRIARHAGAMLSDVMLATCSAALRRLLQERKALPDETLVAMVPAPTAENGDAATGAAAAVAFVGLASDVGEPLARLRAVAEASRQAGLADGIGDEAEVATDDFSIFAAPLAVPVAAGSSGRRGAGGRSPPAANVVVAGLAGPAVPLYLAGAMLRALHPVSTPTHDAGLHIALQRYDGSIHFGITTCGRLLPEVATLADYLIDGLEELAAAVPDGKAQPDAAQPVPAAPAKKARRRAASSSSPTPAAPVPTAAAAPLPAKVGSHAAATSAAGRSQKPRPPRGGKIAAEAPAQARAKTTGAADARPAAGVAGPRAKKSAARPRPEPAATASASPPPPSEAGGGPNAASPAGRAGRQRPRRTGTAAAADAATSAGAGSVAVRQVQVESESAPPRRKGKPAASAAPAVEPGPPAPAPAGRKRTVASPPGPGPSPSPAKVEAPEPAAAPAKTAPKKRRSAGGAGRSRG